LAVPESFDESERVAGRRIPPKSALIALAAAVLVVVAGSLAVALTRHGPRSNTLRGFSIQALGTTTRQDAARVTISESDPLPSVAGSSAGQPATLTYTLTGLVDFRRHVARVEVSSPGAPSSPSYLQLDIGGRVYNQLTAATTFDIPPELRKGKRWVESDVSNSADPFGFLIFDPLAQLRAAKLNLKDLGTTRLNKQEVHHFHGTSSESPSSATGNVRVTLTIDIFVDGRNRLVRLRSTDNIAGIKDPGVLQIDVSDYGVAVNVTAPPANEVVHQRNFPSHT
jgi:hypothetical protein